LICYKIYSIFIYFLALFLFFVFFSSGTHAQHIIAVGGGDQSRFLPIFLEKAGGPSAKIALIAAASKTPEGQLRQAKLYRESLKLKESQFVFYKILSKEDANQEEFLKAVADCTGIILSGGSQSLIADRILGTKVHEILLDFSRRGGIILSNSAGTAALGPIMITGDDPTTERVFLAEGLSLIDSFLFDQHFLQRDRIWRLRQAVAKYPNLTGIGIDEGSALIIEGDSMKEIGQITTIKSGK
jgi:cyanophycinase